MDNSSETIKNFEELLRNQSTRKPIALYKDSKSENSQNDSKPTCTAHDILSDVSRQLKALQNADCVRTERRVPRNMYKCKTASFVPVNMLQEKEVPHQRTNINKFDTQCVSNTQLINIIQVAEALDTYKGVTQEFETSFGHAHNIENTHGIKITEKCIENMEVDGTDDVENQNQNDNNYIEAENSNRQIETAFPIIDISLKESDPNTKIQILDKLVMKYEINENKNMLEDNIAANESQALHSIQINKTFAIDDNVDKQSIIKDIDQPSSPVFGIKPINKISTPFPLVFDLEAFEKFERLAAPIVEETLDIEIAKQIIYSQLIGKELCIQANTEPILNEIDKDISSIHTNNNGIVKIDDSIKVITSEIHTEDLKGKSIESSHTSNDKYILKDEILFSSDEEEEYMHKHVQDLPFTCVLETSFSEQSDILDKTMYVGFQTASSKSIQVSTDSFYRAKSLLDNLTVSENEPTLTELVEKCDANKIINTDMDDLDFVTAEGFKSDLKIADSTTSESKDIDLIESKEDDTSFIGFETANGKSIDVFKDAFIKSKALFQDINIDLTDHTKDADSYLTNPSQIVSKINKRYKTTSNKNLRLSDITTAESEYQFKEIDLQQAIDLSNLQLDNCNENAIENIKNKITEKIAEIFDTSCKQKNNIENYETVHLKETCKEPKLDDDILKEFECVEMSQESIDSNRDDGIEKVTGFKTANGKEIIISDAAIARTKNIFQDIDLVEEPSKAMPDSKDPRNPDDSTLSNKIMISSSNEEYQEQTDIGFKTASNKQIKISEQALAKTKNIFHYIDSVEVKNTKISTKGRHTKISEANMIISDNLNHPITSKTLIGFKTHSNKAIKISDEELAKAKSMFQDIEKDDYEKPLELAFEGFETTSNKNIEILADFLAISKEIFQNVESDNKQHDFGDVPTNIKKFAGFTIANNEKIATSKEALRKSEKLFSDKDILDPFNKNTVDFSTIIENTDKIPVFKGFQTASMKPVKVSAQALAKSKAIFLDIDNEISKSTADDNEIVSKCNGVETTSNKAINISENDNIEASTGLTGFQTASNKKVRISEEALAKSRKMFEEVGNFIKDEELTTGFKGFQTASNKEVTISDEALAKSKKIFEDIENVNENTGFQTVVVDKEVRISKEVLAKSRKMLEEVKKFNDNKVTSTNYQGFQTASNKQVRISEESLAKSKEIFEEFDNCYEDNEAFVHKSSSFKGFQTASNKQVNISKQALANSRQLFQDIGLDYEISTHAPNTNNNNSDMSYHKEKVDNRLTKNKPTVFGFKTTHSSNIKVSEEALFKSRKLLANFDIDQNKTSGEHNLNNLETKLKGKTNLKEDVNLENIINTQVLNNFEETLYTEDFCKETPKKSKRSGSPILSCPKAKKRKKFEIPYSQRPVNDIKDNIPSEKIQNKIKKPERILIFDENYKKSKKYNLKHLQALEKESKNTKTHTDPYILDFDFENLLNFKFSGYRNDITDSHWTIDDLKSHFLDSVNKKFIPDCWIDNHLKLILWKLISYEVKFPKTMSQVCTARNLIEQLKYRYDKELYNAERPALRKIMEKDDTSTRTLVLCVVAMFENGVKVSSITNLSNNIEVLLTDGWYCMKANTDKMLTNLIADGKIVVGSKIVTNGAELVNCEQGVSPWEDTSSIRLKLSGNSTRRARWDARLGYHAGAILCPLSAVRADGGRVSHLRVVAARVYPALYVERFEDGSTVTRSERLEHQHQMRHETERQALMERIYEEVEKEFSDQDSQDSDGVVETGNKRSCLDSGSQIAKVMKTSKDPLEFRSHLTDTQKSLLQEHTTRKREKLLENIQRRVVEKMENAGLNARRNVIRLLKVRVAGAEERGGAVEVTRAMLSVWKPTDVVLEMITEGSWIEVMNVVPTAIRYSEIQISAGRQSVFSLSKRTESEKTKPYIDTLKRTCYPIKDLTKNPSMTTDYNEIDTVGLICSIEPSIKEFDGKIHQFQNVCLADADQNIVCANFWGGLKKFGFENVLDTGQIVACTNLQKRAGNTRKNIPQYRVTEFSYFTKMPRNDQARKIAEDLSVQLSSIDRRRFCEDCVCIKNNSAAKLHENVTPYRFQNVDINATKNRVYIDSPLPQKNEDNLNLTGLDFESTFKQTDTQDLSPKALLRKKKVNEKIAKLKMYGEPPPLSPIHIFNTSKNAAKAYKSPLISKSDVSSVAGEEKSLPKEQEKGTKIEISSPIINRTFVKRTNVNPVKLNFDNVAIDVNNASDVPDHFAEDFDASPPLSLD